VHKRTTRDNSLSGKLVSSVNFIYIQVYWVL